MIVPVFCIQFSVVMCGIETLYPRSQTYTPTCNAAKSVPQPRRIEAIPARESSQTKDLLKDWGGQGEPKVTMNIAPKALAAVFEATHIRVMEGLSMLEQVLLASLILEAHFQQCAACELSAVSARASLLLRTRPCKTLTAGPAGSAATYAKTSEAVLPSAGLFVAVNRLCAAQLVSIQKPRLLWSQELVLIVPLDDVLHVLQESSKVDWIHSMLGAAKND